MRNTVLFLVSLSCSLPTIDPFGHAPPNLPANFDQGWQENLSGNWKLISSTEDDPPTELLAIRVYNPETKFFECPSMVASVANHHEVQFYDFFDLCFVDDSAISSRLFPQTTDDYRVEGTFTFHAAPNVRECVTNPTNIDCLTQDDYYVLTLDLYQFETLVRHRVYRKAFPSEEHVPSNHTYVTLYDEQQLPYEFFLDSRDENNYISLYCPASLRTLFHVDSPYADRIPFEFACVADDNSFIACSFADQSYCITGTFSEDLTTITYHTPDGITHTLTQ